MEGFWLVLNEKVGKKIANRTSHRYNRLPLLPSGPGGVQQELVVPVCQRKDKESLASPKCPSAVVIVRIDTCFLLGHPKLSPEGGFASGIRIDWFGG
jgi:hypothetical protein